jgi:PAS domain S-box-containing protein
MSLAASEQRFKLLVESVVDYAIFILDPRGVILTWNAGAERIKGYAASESVGAHFSRFYRSEDVASGLCEAHLTTALRDGRTATEGWRVRKDGSQFWASVVITALRGPSGEHVGFAKVTRDLTTHRAADEKVHEAEERFRLLVESVKGYAIFALDPQGLVVTWNAGAERIKGYKADDIIGRHFSIFYAPAEAEAGQCEHELGVAAHQGRFEDEGWRLRKDGTRFWAHVAITALRDEQGTLRGFAKVTQDLSDRRRSDEERLRLAQEQEANRVKDEFLATLSHELRTPLNAILGWSVLLQESVEAGSPLLKGIQTIQRNAQAQAKIIDDILDVSRIITGKMRIEAGSVELAAVVRAAIEVVRPSALAKDIALVLDAPAEVPVIGDATRLQQVVWNLLSNAVKFTSQGGEVRVGLATTASDALLEVADNGRGIDPAFLPEVFDAFRQADSSTTRRHGGLGLGLAIVRNIVGLHGGVVSASSDGLGQGATFRVVLPLALTATVEPTPTAESFKTAMNGIYVLIVDDDEDAREMLAEILSARGSRVSTTGSVEQALEIVATEPPSVIVTDIAMPNADGYELLRRLLAMPGQACAAVPVIALSAYARREDRDRGVLAGFHTYFTKPVNPRALVDAIVGAARATGRVKPG